MTDALRHVGSDVAGRARTHPSARRFLPVPLQHKVGLDHAETALAQDQRLAGDRLPQQDLRPDAVELVAPADAVEVLRDPVE